MAETLVRYDHSDQDTFLGLDFRMYPSIFLDSDLGLCCQLQMVFLKEGLDGVL